MEQVSLTLTPQQAADKAQIQKAVAHQLHLPSEAIYNFRIVKRSVDARQRDIKILLTVQAFLSPEEAQLPPYPAPRYQDVHHAEHEVHIIGAGPAGLFAALQLLELGIRPIIFERGKDVSARKTDIALLNRNQGINNESNYCFGEGGAGTFSDGKLFSRSKKRGNMQRVMELFHYFGANDGVLYEAHAHIGSDRLPGIIRRMRECIVEHGGEVHFQHCIQSIDVSSSAIPTILAIGHSAHDTYRMLAESGVELEPKGFAFGVRVEHPQSLIDDLLYHHSPLRQLGLLPAASYALVTQVPAYIGQPKDNSTGRKGQSNPTEQTTRGVYSFCMCPGGHIVPAGSTTESGIVNGMSASHRNSPFANSGIVVELHPEDMLADWLPQKQTNEGAGERFHTACADTATSLSDMTKKALQCLEWQERVEHLSWEHGALAAGKPDSAIAPTQRLKDFVNGRASRDLPKTSYLPGCHISRLDQWLPPVIGRSLQQGFVAFDKKYPGFLTNEAVILGVESRSSSPVRIPRDKDTMQAYNQHGQPIMLFPAGEGAGYAGGITSSALDGINAAYAVAAKLGICPPTK